MSLDRLIGIDVGASRIKGAVVRSRTGEVEGEPVEHDTPRPPTPELTADVVAKIVAGLDCPGPIGVGLPCVVRRGIVMKAANIDGSWEGQNAVDLLAAAVPDGRPITVLNDADAAGLAEAHFGEARGRDGTVLVLTFGTGIGSALVHDGRLVPNTEFGHMRIGGVIAERYAPAPTISGRKGGNLTWSMWRARASEFLEVASFLVQADLVVIGGGVSAAKNIENWEGRLKCSVQVVPAKLANRAGIIGAALHAFQAVEPRSQ